MKTCTKCGQTKSLDLFSRKLAGYQSKCKECCRIEHKAWNLANNERAVAYKRARYLEKRDVFLEKQKVYYAANKADRLQYASEWRKANMDKIRREYLTNVEQYKARVKRWRENNPDARRAQEVARRSRLRWIPPWADRAAMAALYKEARQLRQLGVDVHVDHVVPLRGKTVSGLHVHTNLRIVLAEDNLKKGSGLIEGVL